MIFTIGHIESYEQYLDECAVSGKPPMKVGKTDDWRGSPYQGGSVFKTDWDATKYLLDNEMQVEYGVYGLLADWETDTEINPSEPYRNLLRDAELVRYGM